MNTNDTCWSRCQPVCRPSKLLLHSVVLLSAVCLTGCGAIGSSSPVPVAGTVTLNGEPLASADIVFIPQNPQEEQPVVRARVIAGKFSLPEASGLLEGTYDVTIVRPEPEFEEVAAAKQAGLPSPLTRTPIPAAYQQQGLLTASVGPAGSNELKFDLTSAPR